MQHRIKKIGGLRLLLGLLAMVLFCLVMISGSAADTGARDTDQHSDEQVEHRGIDIDIVGGATRSLVPLAVPDTIEIGGDTQGAAEEIQEILRHNLELAGYFRMLPPDSFFFDTTAEGMSAANIEFQNWLNVGAQGLIKSSVRLDGEEYTLDLRLYSVEQGRRINVGWQASPVAQGGIRGQVNDFINAVLMHYTGQEGIFGSRIAFSRRNSSGAKHIYVMNMDGSNQRQISTYNGLNLLPRFGANGDIFFTSYRAGNPDLWVYRNGSLRSFSSQEGQNSGAAYCNGQVAVTLARGTENTDIYLVDATSGAVRRQLTDHWAIDVSPTWSPDCSQIAFVSGRRNGAHIFLMNADGSDQRRLTFQGTYNTTPDWSPRGDRIVFSGRDERNAYDIFTVDMDGNIRRLTQDQGNNFEPSYSPDGRYIVFASDRGGQGKRLWLMTHDGQIQRLLTPDGGYEEPVWER